MVGRAHGHVRDGLRSAAGRAAGHEAAVLLDAGPVAVRRAVGFRLAVRVPSASAPTDSASPGPSGSASAKPSQKASAADPRPYEQPGGGDGGGKVKAYTVTGGRVVFDLGTTSAELVSATPDAGWQMQVWKQPYWIRVTFTKAGKEMSVFCTWNGHPPLVETYAG